MTPERAHRPGSAAGLRAAWPRVAVAAALLALSALFFHHMLFSGRVFGRGDMLTYFTPYWDVRSAALRAGTLPLWTPDVFMGAPLLANPQLGVFYPGNWALTPLAAADALRISLWAHTLWAAAGAWTLARRALGVGRVPALLAALLLGWGGLLGAQSEHPNQVQGLAWMPWLFWLLDSGARASGRASKLGWAALLAAALALQCFTGHTQTVFIAVGGMAVHALAGRGRVQRLALLAGAGGAALLLASPQLIPTLELSRLSIRAGGLSVNEALSFSLSPFAFSRGLLPGYSALVFPEYVAYLGVIGLGLALLGVFAPRTPERWRWAVLAAAGLALALGAYNPLMWLLAQVPPFSLFRVPARWLALAALGGAMLAALGLQHLAQSGRRAQAVVTAALLLLAAGALLAGRAPDGDVPLPGPWEALGWGLALAALLAGFALRRWPWAAHALAAAAVVELFAASGALPYNQLVHRDALEDRRLTAAVIAQAQHDAAPPGRVLSISALQWDPYDLAGLRARYAAGSASDEALAAAITAAKLAETLGPNLPLRLGISSVDGYDGGVLPTAAWFAFSQRLHPGGAPDGRLREVLADPACAGACIPDWGLLGLMDVRYLLLDKTGDFFDEDIAYDASLPAALPARFANPQRFLATEARVVYTCPATCAPPALAGSSAAPAVREIARGRLAVYALDDAPNTPEALAFAGESPATLLAVTLVDARTGDFQQLAPAPFTRIWSSDVKLYENADAARAHLLRDGAPSSLPGDALSFTRYSSTEVTLSVQAAQPAQLVLADSTYPGWQAQVNGQPAAITPAYEAFRAVDVPAGRSEVHFRYAPGWLAPVLALGAGAWALWAGFALVCALRVRRLRR